MKMPTKYVVEMFIDRVAASRNYQREKYTDESPLAYYEHGKQYHIIHEESRELLECLLHMLADRGEGSVDAFITALGGSKVTVKVKNPYFEDMDSYYGLINEGKTAVIEMASCAGLPLVEDRKDPRKTTTYGVGQLILAAAESGVEKIIVGLGGSSTNDGGCGAAAAVGVKFYDRDGKEFVPTGGTTADICKIDLSGKAEILNKVEIVTMCDIDNPMYGPTGASHIFGPQKGADEAMVLELDEGIKNLSRAITEAIGKDISEVPGTGAAGAMGAGMIAFFGSRLQMGIQTVLDTVKFDEMISDADYIITGEGKLDSQSLRGKVVIGIAERAKKQDKNVIAVVGGADDAGTGYHHGTKGSGEDDSVEQ